MQPPILQFASPRVASHRALLALTILTLVGTQALRAQDSAVVVLPDSVVIRPDTVVVPRDSGRSRWPASADPTGADIAVIYPDSLPDMPRTMSELLAARVPGMFVQRSSGATGASSWISMRDAGAVNAAEPLLVVDGVRRVATPVSYNFFTGSRVQLSGERLRPSPIDDIPVDQVERVEILRGPAAAARYGRDARYGVIVVTTRHPASGAPRYRASLTGGFADEDAKFPANYAHLATDGTTCSNPAAAAGWCTQAGTSSYSVLRDRSPFATGGQRGARIDATAGFGPVALALGASHVHAEGVLPMDAADHTAVTARLRVPFGERVRLSANAQSSLRGVTQPAQGGSTLDVIGGGIYADPIDCSPTTPCPTGTTSHGYRYGNPEYLAALGPRHRLQHFSHSAALEVDATHWLSSHTSISLDNMGDNGKRVDGPVPDYPYQSFSKATVVSHATRAEFGQSLRARWVLAGLQATTSLDAGIENDVSNETYSDFFSTVFDGTVLSSGAWGGMHTDDHRTTLRLEQRANAGDRASFGAGASWIRTKPLGASLEIRPTLDGFADASVNLVSPANAMRGLRSLRVRTAVGQVSGYDFSSLSRFVVLLPPVYTFPSGQAAEPPPLRAQRSVEFEGGFDAELSPAQLRLSLTAYRRTETEPYVPIPIPSTSGGYGALDMQRRLTGVELSAGAMLIDVPQLRWLTHGHFALSGDRVTRWNLFPRAISGVNGAQLVLEKGKHFGSWLSQPPVWSDANGDGVIGVNEVTYTGDFGPDRARSASRPTQAAGLQNSITILHALTIGAQLDYVGGHKVLDGASAAQCRLGMCAAVNDPRASLAEQARGVSAFTGGTLYGYLESGATVRLRELSVSFGSARMASLAHAGSLSFTLAGRNLATWSRYHGLDPEMDLPDPGMSFNQSNAYTTFYLPNTRQFTARLTLAY